MCMSVRCPATVQACVHAALWIASVLSLLPLPPYRSTVVPFLGLRLATLHIAVPAAWMFYAKICPRIKVGPPYLSARVVLHELSMIFFFFLGGG